MHVLGGGLGGLVAGEGLDRDHGRAHRGEFGFYYDPDGGFVINPCGNTPVISLTSSSLINGSAPVRFSTPVLAGVSFNLSV